MKLQKKILLILVVLLGLFILSDSKSYAVTFSTEQNGETYVFDYDIDLSNKNYVVYYWTREKSNDMSYWKGIQLVYCDSSYNLVASDTVINCIDPVTNTDFRGIKYVDFLIHTGRYSESYGYETGISYNNQPDDVDYYPVASFNVIDNSSSSFFRESGSGNGGSSSGGSINSNTSNTINQEESSNTVTNSTSGSGGSSGSSGNTSESDEEHGWLGTILNNIFGGFIDGTLGTIGRIFDGIGNILTTIGNVLINLVKLVGFLNPESDDFILKVLWEHLLNIIEGLGKIVLFVLNFFTNLLDFVLHLVVPTDSQWQEIKSNFQDLFITIENHVPLWSFIKSTITDAQNTSIINNDALVVKIPAMVGFGLFSGSSSEVQYINVLEAYEPFRVQIRGLLFLIVIASAFVYIVKHVTDYHANTSGSNFGVQPENPPTWYHGKGGHL